MNLSDQHLKPDAFGQYARWYDAFNAGKNYGAEIQYLLDRIQDVSSPPRRWLDVGCGTGGHASQIRSRGIAVEGLDHSSAMIECARRTHPHIAFHVGSAQDFTLEGDRDVISMLFHVMNYQHSDVMIQGAMHAVRAHLAPAGLFVFDFWNSDAVALDPPGPRVREAVVDSRSLFRLSEPVVHPERRLVEVRYQFRWDSQQGPLVHEELHVLRHFTERELKTFLESAGMTVLKCNAWMTDRPLSERDWYGFMCAGTDPSR
jgi:SAM-dependent methyltransferase